MVALILLVVACMFYPFLPGNYDDLAVTLSFMAQLLGIAGLLLVPVGLLWLIYEIRKRAQKQKEQPGTDKGYYFAIISMVAASLVAFIVLLPAFFNTGYSFGMIVLSLWIVAFLRTVSRIRRMKGAKIGNFNPAPLYLMAVPLAVFLFRWALIEPATEFSRNYAIQHSAQLIHDIEAYYDANGQYPISLASVWKDYKPSVIGIEQFYYESSGDSYNVFFEQFTFQLDTREFVVYNKFDEQEITSHDSWILVLTPEELNTARGYYAVHDASSPHWKYFWFD